MYLFISNVRNSIFQDRDQASLMATLYFLGWKISISLVFLLGRWTYIITGSPSVYAFFQNQNAFYALIRLKNKKGCVFGEKNKHPCPQAKPRLLAQGIKQVYGNRSISCLLSISWAQSGAHLCVHKSFLQIHSESNPLPGACDRLVLCHQRDGLMISAKSWHVQEI